MAGISRSATLVVAYLMKKYGYSMNSIISLLKRKRSIVTYLSKFLDQSQWRIFETIEIFLDSARLKTLEKISKENQQLNGK